MAMCYPNSLRLKKINNCGNVQDVKIRLRMINISWSQLSEPPKPVKPLSHCKSPSPNPKQMALNHLWKPSRAAIHGAAGARLRCKSKPNASSKLGPPSPFENLLNEGPSVLPWARACTTCDPIVNADESPTAPAHDNIPALLPTVLALVAGPVFVVNTLPWETWNGGAARGTYTHDCCPPAAPAGTTTVPAGARRWGGGAKADMMGFLTYATAAFRVACIWARLSCCLSFLWAFWWPPRACELANSRQQYWHSYFRSPEGGKAPESDDPDGVLEESTGSSSSWTLKPKSFKRVVVVAVGELALGLVW